MFRHGETKSSTEAFCTTFVSRPGAACAWAELSANRNFRTVGAVEAALLIPGWSDLDKPMERTDYTLPNVGTFSGSGPLAVGVPVRAVDGRGWPMVALWCHRSVQSSLRRDSFGSITVTMTEADTDSAVTMRLPNFGNYGNFSRALPLRLAWPGFAINTLLYAALLWLLFAAPFQLRRWRRMKRGLCPKCAYDLRGGSHQACPECGQAAL